VTKQINNLNKFSILKAQKLSIPGDILQSLGAGLQAIGGKEILMSEEVGICLNPSFLKEGDSISFLK
jgi:hypothetical protein